MITKSLIKNPIDRSQRQNFRKHLSNKLFNREPRYFFIITNSRGINISLVSQQSQRHVHFLSLSIRLAIHVTRKSIPALFSSSRPSSSFVARVPYTTFVLRDLYFLQRDGFSEGWLHIATSKIRDLDWHEIRGLVFHDIVYTSGWACVALWRQTRCYEFGLVELFTMDSKLVSFNQVVRSPV